MTHPTWQHAFDVFDDNERSRELIAGAMTLGQEKFVEALGTMGLPPDEISHQLERARSSTNPIRGEWTWERTTRVGFRNPLGQVVVRKTDEYGDRPFQRLYELQCEECHHRYRCSGFEVHATACPRCQANR